MEAKPNPPSFLELLNEVYEEEDKERSSNGPREYHHNPSSATMLDDSGSVVGACLRALYYRAISEPVSDPKGLTTKLQGDFGNGIHDKIADKLAKSKKIKTVPELPGRGKFGNLEKEVSWREDNRITHLGEQGVLEIKTKTSFAVQNIVRRGGPDGKDILQVLAYLGLNPELRWAVLLYVGRDNAFRAEYHIYKDPKTDKYVIKGVTPASYEKEIKELSFDKVVERWKVLEGHIERKELPNRDYKAVLKKDGTPTLKREKNSVVYETDATCKYCSWYTKCWTLPDAFEHSKNVKFE